MDDSTRELIELDAMAVRPARARDVEHAETGDALKRSDAAVACLWFRVERHLAVENLIVCWNSL